MVRSRHQRGRDRRVDQEAIALPLGRPRDVEVVDAQERGADLLEDLPEVTAIATVEREARARGERDDVPARADRARDDGVDRLRPHRSDRSGRELDLARRRAGTRRGDLRLHRADAQVPHTPANGMSPGHFAASRRIASNTASYDDAADSARLRCASASRRRRASTRPVISVTITSVPTIAPRVVERRRVAVRPEHLFHPAVALDRDERVLVPGRLAAGHHGFDLRADHRPRVRPAIARALPHRRRGACRARSSARTSRCRTGRARAPRTAASAGACAACSRRSPSAPRASPRSARAVSVPSRSDRRARHTHHRRPGTPPPCAT